MQQKIFLFLPVIFTFMFLAVPSGLVIYWLVSNLLAIGQQYMTNRMIGGPPPRPPAVVRAVSPPKKAPPRVQGDREVLTGAPHVMSKDFDHEVIEFVTEVTAAMGLDSPVDVEETPDNVRLNLTGEGADALLRRKGEALDALQVIVNTAFRRDARGDRHYVVDALGFRKGKDAELRQMAQFLMEKARTTASPQEIGPLNPYARRIVHLTVAEDDRADVRKHRRRVPEDGRHFTKSLTPSD